MLSATLSDLSRSLNNFRAVSSVLLPVMVVGSQRVFPSAWTFMWALAFSIFLSCKFLSLTRVPFAVTWSSSFSYIVFWPGLNAASFLKDRVSPKWPLFWEWMKGLIATFSECVSSGAIPFSIWIPSFMLGWV